jgi:hypothetical protein
LSFSSEASDHQKEIIMKNVMLAAIFAGGTLASLGGAAHAASRMAPGIVNGGSSPSFQQIDDHCGPHRHWVPEHRDRDGHRVGGHCE